MKSAIAFLLILTVAVTSTDAMQWAKIPKLVEHFCKHRNEDKTLSFSEFLAEHYLRTSQENTSAEDMELPFKQAEYSGSIVALAISQGVSLCLKPLLIPVDRSLSEKPEMQVDSEYTSGVWQPPRNA